MFPSLFSHEPFPISSSFSNSMFTFVIGNTWPSATKGELWWNWGVGSFEEEVRMGRRRKDRTAGPPISKSSRKFVCSDIFWYPLVSFCCPRPPLQCNEVRMDSRGKARKAGPSIACIVQVSSGILWYPFVPSAQCEEVKVGRRRNDMRARSPIFRKSSWQEGSDDHCKHFHLVFSLLKQCSQRKFLNFVPATSCSTRWRLFLCPWFSHFIKSSLAHVAVLWNNKSLYSGMFPMKKAK